MEYLTNTNVEHHSTWTLTKHVMESINKAAAKTDAQVYGTYTNVIVIPKPIHHPVKDTLAEIGIGIVLLFVFIMVMTGQVRKRDLIGP